MQNVPISEILIEQITKAEHQYQSQSRKTKQK